jgi:glycosyltransferase involved in cell wall biosynthesis
MRVWAYCTEWNEERMIPYYIRHYSQFCEKIIFYDNESTDRSREIIESYPNTEVRVYQTGGVLNDQMHVDLKEMCILEAKKNGVDYAIVSDCDEFIYHEDILKFLDTHLDLHSVLYPIGYQMVSDTFPKTEGNIYDEINIGKPDGWYCKPILINLHLIESVKFTEGCHEIYYPPKSRLLADVYHPIPKNKRPNGQIGNKKWGNLHHLADSAPSYTDHDLKLLHYKYVGREYLKARYQEYARRIGRANKIKGYGSHYQKALDENKIDLEFDNLISKAEKVI